MVDFTKKIRNSSKFLQSAKFFLEHGVYTLAPRGTTDYNTFWDRETDRCLNGYVAASGTFTKAASMTSWTRDQNGIPSGWTVQNA